MEHKMMEQTNKGSDRPIIVLAADQDYETHLMTTIKSVCYHNVGIDFYLFNSDFPIEWFENLNKRLEHINCSIKDIKLNYNVLKDFPTYPHISSETTFYRYFIADKIDAEKALYLDADLVVTDSLSKFFEVELGNNYVAACLDYSGFLSSSESVFNAGVILVNIPLWKKDTISSKALYLSEHFIHQVPSADQSILNILFENRWLELNYNFNYLTGAEYRCNLLNEQNKILRKENEVPLVIHYNTQNKPWTGIYELPLRKHYWYYRNLEWNEIYLKHQG